METIYKRVCGLDIHKKVIVACMRTIDGAGKVKKTIRKFGSMTRELLSMYDWLQEEGVTHVAMESTGVYWKPIWNILEGGFDITLVNAKHIKQVPGRKTDMKDSEWIAQLLQHGLLSKSFVPTREIRELRDLTRQRTKLIQEKVSVVNRVQKILEDANIKLSSVASDIMGASGRSMIEAIIRGEEDSTKLAELARRRMRGKIPELKLALEGKVTEHHRFMLKILMKHIRELEMLIEEISERVEEVMRPFEHEVSIVKTLDGLNQRTVETLLAEIGTNMKQFPSDAHLASWAGMCPGNNESAGKTKSGKTPKGNIWLRRALGEAAWAASRTKDTFLRAQYERIAARRGKKRAIVAVGHTILTSVYHMLKEDKVYEDLGPEHFIRLHPERNKKYHIKKLEALGYKVIIEDGEQVKDVAA